MIPKDHGVLIGRGGGYRPTEEIGENLGVARVFFANAFEGGLNAAKVGVGGYDRPARITPGGLGSTTGGEFLTGPLIIEDGDLHRSGQSRNRLFHFVDILGAELGKIRCGHIDGDGPIRLCSRRWRGRGIHGGGQKF